jgi:hypothetical protein
MRRGGSTGASRLGFLDSGRHVAEWPQLLIDGGRHQLSPFSFVHEPRRLAAVSARGLRLKTSREMLESCRRHLGGDESAMVEALAARDKNLHKSSTIRTPTTTSCAVKFLLSMTSWGAVRAGFTLFFACRALAAKIRWCQTLPLPQRTCTEAGQEAEIRDRLNGFSRACSRT